MNPTMALPRVQPLRSPAVALDTVVITDAQGYYRGSLRRFSDAITEWVCEHAHVDRGAAVACALVKWEAHKRGA